MKQKKISMNIDTKLLSKIDNFAEAMGVNRSSAIAFISNIYFCNLQETKEIDRISGNGKGGINGTSKV